MLYVEKPLFHAPSCCLQFLLVKVFLLPVEESTALKISSVWTERESISKSVKLKKPTHVAKLS